VSEEAKTIAACTRGKIQLPRHVAIIMDGNGRWAQSRALPRLAGHQEGAKSVREVVRASRKIGLEALTLYAFSAQNWARPGTEVAGLMTLLRDYLIEERPEIMDNGIVLRAIGDLDRLPPFVREPLDALIADSAGNTEMILNLALSYGGRESIVRAARQLACKVASGELEPSGIDLEAFAAQMPTAPLPELDLLIRTSGEQRISNFLLWEAGYAELYFTDVLWPDFRKEALLEALDAFSCRERRYGRTGAQIESGDLEP